MKPIGRASVTVNEGAIDAILRQVGQCQLPGVAVGIALRGRPAYRKGFGLASIELPVVLSPTIRMRVGSISKHFTALAYMLLCEEGRAGIDDSLGIHLPEVHPIARGITMRQLMGHVSGLRDAYNICVQFSGVQRRVSTQEMISFYRDIDDVNAAPGTAWIYNNGGYQLLSTIIERISDQALEDVLRERVFTPAGMRDTALRRWDDDLVDNSATLHMTKPGGGLEKSSFRVALAGEGGIVSTVDDMLRWLAHMDAPQIGSAAAWEVMRTPQTLANGTSTGYGLGLRVNSHRGAERLWHAGGLMGGNSQVLKVPAAGIDIIIMANRHDVSAMVLTEKILETCFSDLTPLATPAVGSCAAGIFYSVTTRRVIQLLEREGRQIASIDGSESAMIENDEGLLCPAPPRSYVKQWIALAGGPKKPAAIRFSDYGNVDELKALEPMEAADAAAIAGRYRSRSTGIELVIHRDARLTSLTNLGSAAFHLGSLARNIWQATATGALPLRGILSFDDDGRACYFCSERTRALCFERID